MQGVGIVLQKKTEHCSWGLGLTADQNAMLRRVLGDDHRIAEYPSDCLPSLEEFSSELPCMAWLSSDYISALDAQPHSERQILELLPKVLLLHPEYSLEDFEKACDHGIVEILRPPFLRERIVDVMRRALEAQALHYDMHCMTREIMLERELLERKNEILSFLVNFLADTSQSLELDQILQHAYTAFNGLLPVRALHAAFWERDSSDSNALSLHLSCPENSKEHDAWREVLIQHCRLVIGRQFSVQNISRLHLPDQADTWKGCLPDNTALLCLPVSDGVDQSGILLLVSSFERHLGRDQATALDSAVRHLGLCVSNARRFRRLQLCADYDILTKVHSRRHFEAKLEEEVLRFSRYGQATSLIMLDIDHFKSINDRHGHHTGDMVLREVGTLLMDSVRNTDYCARYGGEEFVIILPHTDADQAHRLADRMRDMISSHTFLAGEETPLQLTVSMGIASLGQDACKTSQSLLKEADAALYAAKNNGRNRVHDASQIPSEPHVCAG